MMSKRWEHFAAAILFGTLITGCASEENSTQMAPLPVIDSEFIPISLWSSKVGNGIGKYFSHLTLAFAYEKVFSADRDGTVSGIDVNNGKVLWSVNLGKDVPALISGGITASYSRLYLGTETGDLIALDEKTGNIVWHVKTGGEILSKPLADAGVIVVNFSHGVLAAYEADTGKERWRILNEVPNLTLRGDSSPVSISGGVFWGMANGRLGAAFIENGNIIWQQTIASPKGAREIHRIVDVDATPVIYDSLLYAVGYNGSLVAIDLRSGHQIWQRPYSSSTDILVVSNYLFLVTNKDHVVAVNVHNGTEIWSNNKLEYRQLTPPVAISGYIVVGDSEGYLHWLDPKSGEFIAQQQLNNSGIAVAPVLVDDGYIVVTRDGNVSKKQMP
ncbi:outer membrane protein assembly factor BamB [Candidatus Enterovibrio altilux]|uniref:outer membrane protein assembly factor BamB n=1 Tax=Candidatus Enterovibrio altilux TaxID=1927128 RepID=UPI000BBCEDC8|nr:outer membrane protein assembly factor BamB [Candidatus Enterovibrio luxaltus]